MCKTIAPLVRSHVIPRAFFDLQDNNAKIISNVEGQRPKKAPIGVYDRIVCASCEKRFGEFDNYAARVLFHDLNRHERVIYGGKLVAIIARAIDYELLKLFSISVIWRASVSTHHFYSRVDLGPHEGRARQMLIARRAGDANEFSSWWSYFDTGHTLGLMDPFKERWFGVNAYRFYFGRVLNYVKVDRRQTPSEFRDLALSPGRDLVMIARDFTKSKDAIAMKAVLRAQEGKR